jgi:hypothetical protein
MQAKAEMKIVVQNAERRTVEDNGSPIIRLGDLWCALMHDSPGWPIHGHYTCLACGRQHLVAWEQEFTYPEAFKNADLQAPAEHLGSTPAVLPDNTTAFAGLQSIPRMEHRMR